MCDRSKSLGLIALSFGAGVAMCAILPAGMLVVIESTLIITAGVSIVIGR